MFLFVPKAFIIGEDGDVCIGESSQKTGGSSVLNCIKIRLSACRPDPSTLGRRVWMGSKDKQAKMAKEVKASVGAAGGGPDLAVSCGTVIPRPRVADLAPKAR